MPTIKDVAKDAGVSPSTVSRVINDHPRISNATKKKVKKSMKKIGYHPNIIAQSLVKQKTNTIGLVMPYSAEEAFANPFYSEILRGIGAVAQEKGYSILLITCDGQEEVEASLRAVKSKLVDGILILRAKKDDILLKKLREAEVPFVIVGRPEDADKYYWVNNDNIKASKNLVQHLIDLGHKDIALITGGSEYIVSQDRLDGYKLALKENKIKYNPEYIIHIHGNEEIISKNTKKLLKKNPDLTAIFAVDDLMAYRSILAIKELGLKVPEDISVVGFNNNPLSQLITPSLTTVDINTYQLGEEATSILINVIENKISEYYHKVVEANIIIRNSCDKIKF